MDRRTLLAIALSFVVITVYSRLYGPKPSPREPVPPAGAPAEAPARVEPDQGEPAAGAPSIVADEFGGAAGVTEESIVVETPFYAATFSNRGGGLISLVLREYVGPEGEPLELVIGDRAEPALSIGRETENARGSTDLSETLFEVSRYPANGLSTGEIVFTASGNAGQRVTRRYTLYPDNYVIELFVRVEGMPVADGSFDVAWNGGLPVTERQVRADLGEFKTLIRVGENIEERKLSDFRRQVKAEWFEGGVRWAATRSKYFISALVMTAGDAGRAEVFGDAASRRLGYRVASPLRDGIGEAAYRLYVGPIAHEHLAQLGVGIERKIGIAAAGGGLLGGFAKVIYGLMVALYGIIPNYGVVIIIIGVATKVLFHPLTRWSTRKMKEMQVAMAELKPRVDEIQKKHKDDPMRGYREIQALYKKHNVSQTAGCLPMLVQMPIQIPIFWSLWSVLRGAIELRQAPFTLWVNDLSAPDTLFHLGPLAVHVLPLLMAATTILMQKTTMTAGPRQPAAMTTILPIVMLVFFYSLPAGLNLYWTAQNVLSWGEQALIRAGKTTVHAKAA